MTIILRLTALIIALLAMLPANAGILGIDGEEATSVGIYIKDLGTGKVIAAQNASVALTPASVTKIVTTATALSLIGPDYHFETQAGLSGARSTRDKSIWEGDIIIVSSGDPTLESDEFDTACGFADSIVSRLRALGISGITGSVSVIQTMKDAGTIPQWECEDIAWPYGAGLYGFNYAGNCVRAYPNKGTTRPASNLGITVVPSPDTGSDIMRGAGATNLTVIAPEKKRRDANWNLSVTVPDPAAVFCGVLTGKLQAAGITIGQKFTDNPRVIATPVYTHLSPASADIMRNLMKRSDNLFAEGMLRAIDPSASRDDCLKAERKFLEDCGIAARYTIIKDGSGLTRGNKISPLALGQLLEYMARTELADTYLGFFPVAGIDGTLKSFLKKSRLKGKLALKTGSVSAVQTYAGYKTGVDGKPTHVVVVMVNGFFCPRATLRGAIEKFLLKTFE